MTSLAALKIYISLKVAFRIYKIVKNKIESKGTVVKVEK